MRPFILEHGKRYRATILLTLLQRFAGNKTIARKLRGVGFTDVTVSGSGATRYADAVWSGPDTTMPLPPQVVSVTEVLEKLP